MRPHCSPHQRSPWAPQRSFSSHSRSCRRRRRRPQGRRSPHRRRAQRPVNLLRLRRVSLHRHLLRGAGLHVRPWQTAHPHGACPVNEV